MEGYRENYESEKTKHEKVISEMREKLLSSETHSSQLQKQTAKLLEEKVPLIIA